MTEQAEGVSNRTTVRLLRDRGGERTPIKLNPRQHGYVSKEAAYIDPEGPANARFCLTVAGLTLEFDGDAEDVLGFSGPEICRAVLAAQIDVTSVREMQFWRGDRLCAVLPDNRVMDIGELC